VDSLVDGKLTALAISHSTVLADKWFFPCMRIYVFLIVLLGT
jgi:hypothetical protein